MVTYKNGFILHECFSSSSLLLEIKTDFLKECMNFYVEESLTGIVIKNRAYFKLHDLDFLKNYPFIKKLEISNPDIIDLRRVSFLSNLECLSLEYHSAGLDFKRVAHSLKELVLLWSKGQYINFDSLEFLEVLRIERDAQDVQYPPNIQDLGIFFSKKNNLEVLESLKKLKILNLYGLTKLTDLSGLKYVSESLETLKIETCNKIETFNPILELKKLKELQIITRNKMLAKELKENLSNRLDMKIRIF